MREERKWLKVQEVADRIGVARATVYKWARKGRLPIYKLADKVARVRLEDLEALIKEARPLYGESENEKQEEKALAADPILGVLGSLSGKPLSAEELEEELYGKAVRDA